jgi:hypothetical protein
MIMTLAGPLCPIRPGGLPASVMITSAGRTIGVPCMPKGPVPSWGRPSRNSNVERLALAALDLGRELRHDGVQVTDDAEVRQLEDRRLGVLVDRHDRLGRLHARTVLDGA